jgi:hypothetical protein
VAPLDAKLSGRQPEDPEGWELDRQNAAIRARYAELSYPDALAFAEASFNRLLRVLTAMPDDDVIRPGVQPWTEGQAVIDVVPGQTYRHYANHLPQLWDLAGKATI